MKIHRKIYKRGPKPPSVYARIDWEKAAVLFSRPGEKIGVKTSDKNTPLKETTKTILTALAAVGVIGLIFAFPTVVPALGALAGAFRPAGWRGRRNIERLARQKWVTVEEQSDGTVTVRITKNGMMHALTYELDNMVLIKAKRWDKKWRVVIFDIPEKHKRLRDIFRTRLTQLGLYMLQESVFVSPYPCFDEVEFLRELYGVSFSVRYLLVERVEDDTLLKEHFKL
jgi:hypothetical protein